MKNQQVGRCISRRKLLGVGLGLAGLAVAGAAIGSTPLTALAAAEPRVGGGGGGSTSGGHPIIGEVYWAWVWFDQGSDNPPQGWGGQNGADYFIPLLNDTIGKPLDMAAYNPGTTPTNCYQAIVSAATTACNNAARRATTNRARVVGVGVTWTFPAYGDGSKWSLAQTNYSNQSTYDQLLPPGSTYPGLPAEYGWDGIVDQTAYNDAQPNETWRDYVYRMGMIDNPGDGYRVVVVAVADGEPEVVGFSELIKVPTHSDWQ